MRGDTEGGDRQDSRGRQVLNGYTVNKGARASRIPQSLATWGTSCMGAGPGRRVGVQNLREFCCQALGSRRILWHPKRR